MQDHFYYSSDGHTFLKTRKRKMRKNQQIRFATKSDQEKILMLYKKVSKDIGGIARTESEITADYISENLNYSLENGICLVVEDNQNKKIIGEIHCYKLQPRVFDHVLSELTIVVDQDCQGQGIGKLLFEYLLKHVEETRGDVLRIELIARESNERAIRFYEKLGFKIEGRFEKRIDNRTDEFEADIPMAWFNKNFSKKGYPIRG